MLQHLFGLRGRVGPQEYFLTGLGLGVLKYLGDVMIVGLLAGQLWTPADYLRPSILPTIHHPEQDLTRTVLALGIWTLPFLWIGMAMSFRRALDAGLRPWIGLFFLLPFVRYALILVLVTMPSARAGETVQLFKRPAPGLSGRVRMRAIAVGAGLAVGALSTVPLVYVGRDYGFTLFLAAPFLMGYVQAWIMARHGDQGLGAVLGMTVFMGLLASSLMLAAAFEGLICILMALPLALTVAIFGALLGRFVGALRAPREDEPWTATPAYAWTALAVLGTAEAIWSPEGTDSVTTCVEVDAPREVVWRHVVSFSELPPAHEWFFRLGVSHPLRASIDGHGVGAVRRCQFSTGDFVEPITAWDEPSRLAFDVTAQPPTMRELSFWPDVHPPHLEGSFRSHRGEFRLVELPGGRTRLEGTTWYGIRMRPGGYWTLWSDGLLSRIHHRVLVHVKALAEQDARSR